jgi:7-cyano-7-deazaguanine synthase
LKAIILLSGGIDSTVMLAMAQQQQRNCIALSFDYGQCHKIELEAAKQIASHYEITHHVISLNHAAFKHSGLTDRFTPILKNRCVEDIASSGIPNTYVPARNTLFLAYALGFAEVMEADEIHFGANAMDANPYPDCRPIFFQAFQALFNVATKQSVQGNPPQLITPLLNLDKTAIIVKGLQLKAPLHLTFSCYSPIEAGTPCTRCDACVLRENGFFQAEKFLTALLD